MTGLIADLCKMSGGRSLAGVGLGVPGALDFKEGRIIESPNFPGWDNFPIRSQVEKAVGVPVVIENDASAAAMGERWVGAAQNVDNFLLITLGTGVGGGLVLGGKLWPGETGKAGEIGHMKITPDGPPADAAQRAVWRFTPLPPPWFEWQRKSGAGAEGAPRRPQRGSPPPVSPMRRSSIIRLRKRPFGKCPITSALESRTWPTCSTFTISSFRAGSATPFTSSKNHSDRRWPVAPSA
ncbi:MAG: ROK family protein [Candidatus Manganitrophus sp.]|nr:MAG: ROK family protein [Candidatus Manganitrophus sp.]